MMLNNDPKSRWVNGSLGVIEGVEYDDEENCEFLRVRLRDTGRSVSVYAFTWEMYTFGLADDGQIVSEPAGGFTQYPLRLAWAVTIHKSQGKTFERVEIDIGRGTFASGQAYVALSRCTSFEGITLSVPFQKRDIRTDHRIYKFLTREAYKKAEEDLPFEDKVALIEAAIEDEEALEMVYLKANDTRSKRIIRPLRVAQERYQGKEFPGLFAYCTAREEERMFHVGRILELRRVG